MKIVNRTNTELVCTFLTSDGGVGCGFVQPGKSIDRNFSVPAKVIMSPSKGLEYDHVTTETITVTSVID